MQKAGRLEKPAKTFIRMLRVSFKALITVSFYTQGQPRP